MSSTQALDQANCTSSRHFEQLSYTCSAAAMPRFNVRASSHGEEPQLDPDELDSPFQWTYSQSSTGFMPTDNSIDRWSNPSTIDPALLMQVDETTAYGAPMQEP